MVSRRAASSSVDAGEVQRFNSAMADWWAPNGPAKALQQMNPVRVGFIRDFCLKTVVERGQEAQPGRPLAGVTIADVGCGGGLLSEALARLGASVTGIDASAKAIEVASARATAARLSQLSYRQASPDELEGEQFDVVVCSEVLEHVVDAEAFVGHLGALAKRGLVVSTLNRTAKSYALAIGAAEYLLGLVPPGTHDWDRFVTPAELGAMVAGAGLQVAGLQGMRYNPLVPPYWRLTGTDLDMNYIAAFVRMKH